MRGRGAKAEVLMGRRRPHDAFLPNIYVFPGGRVDPSDYDVPGGIERRPDVARRLTGKCGASPAPALAMPAIHETHEETGFLLGDPGAEHDAVRERLALSLGRRAALTVPLLRYVNRVGRVILE